MQSMSDDLLRRYATVINDLIGVIAASPPGHIDVENTKTVLLHMIKGAYGHGYSDGQGDEPAR